MVSSINECLLRNSHLNPNQTAFTFLEDGENIEQKVTYGQLEVRVKILANYLSVFQLENKRVMMVYNDTLEFIVAFLASQYVGAVPVPVSYFKGSNHLKRLKGILDDAKVSAILCKTESKEQLRQAFRSSIYSDNIRLIETDCYYEIGCLKEINKSSTNEISLIQYTSGSTGNPKGVVITNLNLMHNQEMIKNAFRCNNKSIIFSWLPFHHDMGLIGSLLHTIYVGCTCILMSPFHFLQKPGRWLRAISKYKVTHSGGPNFAYDLCCEKIEFENRHCLDLSNWNVAYNGSERVRIETIERFSKTFGEAGFNKSSFVPCYGLAEATLLVTSKAIDTINPVVHVNRENLQKGKVCLIATQNEQFQTIVNCGKAVSGVQVKILNLEMKQECQELELGEICVSGLSVTNGYWNRATSDAFTYINGKKYFRTGDIGFIFRDDLFVHSRVKENFIIRGQNFYPSDIEGIVFQSHVSIRPNGVAVISIAQVQEEIIIIAEVRKRHLVNTDKETIIQAINTAVNNIFGVDPYDILLTYPFKVPRTTSGKIKRIECKNMYERGLFEHLGSKRQMLSKQVTRGGVEYLVKRNQIKDLSYESIRKYLLDLIELNGGDIRNISSNQEIKLTEIGLDSLRTMQIINTINVDMDLCLDAPQVFFNNTLSDLIRSIETILWIRDTPHTNDEISI
ncbi:MAG: AMP-binding protein [Chitinophagaceae bacterium]|nr:AMP-binding protein [Chitinophagaceae bacterium]